MSTIDTLIFLAFLAFFFLINKYNTPKLKTIQSYASCPASISTFSLFAIVFGTSFNAISLFNTSEQVGLLGFSYFITACADAVRILLLCFFIKAVFAFKNELSVGAIMQQAYGPSSRVIAGICSFMFAFAILAIQIKWVYHTVTSLFIANFNIAPLIIAAASAYYLLVIYNKGQKIKLSYLAAMVFIGGPALYYACSIAQPIVYFAMIFIALFYTSLPGNGPLPTKAIFEFSLIIVLLPIVFSELSFGDNSVMQILAMIPAKMRSITPEILANNNSQEYTKMFFSTIVPVLNPLMIQRIQLASSAKQAQRAFVFSSLTLFIFLHLISICALVAIYLNPKLSSAYQSTNAFLYLINEIVNSPISKGIVFCAVLSVMFSTIDAAINVANVSIIQDIFNYNKTQDVGSMIDYATLFLAILTGLVCWLINIDTKSLLILALNMWVAIVTVPFFAKIFNISAPPAAFYICAVSGVIVYAIYYLKIFPALELVGAVAPMVTINIAVFYFTKLIYSKLQARKILS